MTTLLTQRATWTTDPNMEVVTGWVDDDDCDTYADRTELYVQAMVGSFNITEENVHHYAKTLVNWIYANDSDLAELHAQWNKDLPDDTIKHYFYEGVHGTFIDQLEAS